MKTIFFSKLYICFLLVAHFFLLSNINAQLNSTIENKPLPPIQSNEAKKNASPASPATPLSAPTPIPLYPIQSFYLHPGLLVLQQGKWEGNDHLLNINTNIGVYVTLTTPENAKLNNVSGEQIKNTIEKIFIENKLHPGSLVMMNQPPLPAFEMEILIYPIGEQGYVASLNGRLFESVNLSRFIMEPGMAFQAITWDKKSLIVGPMETMREQIVKAATEITTDFVTRTKFYQNLKK